MYKWALVKITCRTTEQNAGRILAVAMPSTKRKAGSYSNVVSFSRSEPPSTEDLVYKLNIEPPKYFFLPVDALLFLSSTYQNVFKEKSQNLHASAVGYVSNITGGTGPCLSLKASTPNAFR